MLRNTMILILWLRGKFVSGAGLAPVGRQTITWIIDYKIIYDVIWQRQ